MNPMRFGVPGSLLRISALGLAALLPFSGCLGGTSTGADNPDLVLQVRSQGEIVEFNGFIQFFEVNSNPEFFSPPANDGISKPHATIESNPSPTTILKGGKSYTFTHDELARLVNPRPSLPLFKSSARLSAPGYDIPDFNVVLIGFDSTVSLLADVHSDSATGRFSVKSGERDTLFFDLSPEREYAGTVDTSTSAGKALALFVPGTTFYAQVNGNSFRFQGVPEGKLPLRWVSTNGIVHAMEDSLGAEWTRPLQPGERVDSIRVPPPVPTLAPPSASPQGQYAFTDSVAVTLTAETGAVIHYTLDGRTPDTSSPRFNGPVVLRASATIMAVAYLKNWNQSPISVNNYVLVPELPTAMPTGKAFRDSLVVSLSAKSKGASIHYTLDGSTPGANSTRYTQPILISETTTLRAIANVPGLGESRILEEKYILFSDSIASPQ